MWKFIHDTELATWIVSPDRKVKYVVKVFDILWEYLQCFTYEIDEI